jgi:hypothetical protein
VNPRNRADTAIGGEELTLFRKKSAWDKMKDPVAARAPAVRSGLIAAGAAVDLTALSSVVSSIRTRRDQ